MDTSSQLLRDSMETPQTTSYRGRGACMLAGWLYYVIAFFSGAVLGVAIDALLDHLSGRELDSWYHIEYESTSIAILGFGGATLLGLWMGWRSYRPAHDAAAGLKPQPSMFVRSLLQIRRGFGAMLAALLYTRFAVLTGEWPPFRKTLRVLALLLVGGLVCFTWFMGRDSEFVGAAYLGGGLAVVLADCLLVNRITGWRAAGQMTRQM